jgi:hypothetical protein
MKTSLFLLSCSLLLAQLLSLAEGQTPVPVPQVKQDCSLFNRLFYRDKCPIKNSTSSSTKLDEKQDTKRNGSLPLAISEILTRMCQRQETNSAKQAREQKSPAALPQTLTRICQRNSKSSAKKQTN